MAKKTLSAAPTKYAAGVAKMRAAGMSWGMVLALMLEHGREFLGMVDTFISWFKSAPTSVTAKTARASTCPTEVKELLDCQRCDLLCLMMDHFALCDELDCCPDEPDDGG